MGNRAYWVQGVWATWVMGHMDHGTYGQWGPWAQGQFGHFCHNIIITGWILTKILLDIDINVFYLNTPRFFHDGLN